MKKIFLLFLLVFTVYLTGCDGNTFKKISYEELKSKMTNKETFIAYFYSENSKLEDKLEKILIDYELTGYKIDINKLSDEEKNTIKLSIAYENPSIVFIINGNDPTKLSHITDEEIRPNLIIERLKDMNFIKEASQ